MESLSNSIEVKAKCARCKRLTPLRLFPGEKLNARARRFVLCVPCCEGGRRFSPAINQTAETDGETDTTNNLEDDENETP